MMNLFTDLRGVVVEALDQMAAAGELPAGLDTANVTSNRPATRRMATWPPMPRWCWPSPPA